MDAGLGFRNAHNLRIKKQASIHTLRQSLCTYILENGYDIGANKQVVLLHCNLQTTMVYTHMLTKNILGYRILIDKS